jgi:diacylglycerol kinase (ATP)
MSDTQPTETDRAPRSQSRADSFRHAFAGSWYALRTQRNTWIHAFFTVAVLVVGFWVRLQPTEWALLVLAMGLVWTTEFLNTAIEAIADLASPEYHPLAKVGKDVSAGAVLVGAITAVIVGLLVLTPHLLDRLPR